MWLADGVKRVSHSSESERKYTKRGKILVFSGSYFLATAVMRKLEIFWNIFGC